MAKTVPATFAAALRSARAAAGLTQQQLAEKAGVVVSTVFQAEQGLHADPRLSTLMRLADALGVKIDDLRPR